jgi:hypothetical protein
MESAGDNATFTATGAIKAFAEGDYAETVRLLRPVRSYAHRFGGSHAQRDLINLTLVEAAARAGEHRLAAALLTERADIGRAIPRKYRGSEISAPAAAEPATMRC